VQDNFVEMLHRSKTEMPEVRTQVVPQRLFRLHFLHTAWNKGQQSCWTWPTKKASIINMANTTDRSCSPMPARAVVGVVQEVDQQGRRNNHGDS